MTRSMLRLLSVVVLMVPCAAQTTWWHRLGFRNLLQDETELGSGVQIPSFNASCTWSDEIGCYLDYFDHLPDSEIKNYYRDDENCRRITNLTECEEKPECEQASLLPGETGSGCYISISKKEVNRCSKTRKRNVIRGSMCDVWKGMNRCKRVRPKTQQACEAFQTAETNCTWDDGECFLNQESLVRLEFVDRPADAEHVIEMQEICENTDTREACEQYRTVDA